MFDSKRRELEAQMKAEGRLPPGQSATIKFPVLHYGPTPNVSLSTWSLRVFGLVERELSYSWAEFETLPTTRVTCDLHCVTKWSKFDTPWEGPSFRSIAALAGVKPEAKFVIFHAENGFTANLPLDVAMDEDVLLAYKFEGQPLEPDHGFPVRALVPKKYFWKSAKWLRGVEFTDADRLGFWEQAGYNNNADPWKEERYSGWNGGLFG